jgi:hypothetical protein
MDVVWELLHDETVRAILGWVGALGIVVLWIWIARFMIGWRVKQNKREHAEKQARESSADTDEAPKG